MNEETRPCLCIENLIDNCLFDFFCSVIIFFISPRYLLHKFILLLLKKKKQIDAFKANGTYVHDS